MTIENTKTSFLSQRTMFGTSQKWLTNQVWNCSHDMKISFICTGIKDNFHINGFALGLGQLENDLIISFILGGCLQEGGCAPISPLLFLIWWLPLLLATIPLASYCKSCSLPCSASRVNRDLKQLFYGILQVTAVCSYTFAVSRCQDFKFLLIV